MQKASTNNHTPLIHVVNDDPVQVVHLAWLLESSGFKTRKFPGAEEALDALSSQEFPDLIVTDLNMPGIDGWRFCRLLRSPMYKSCNHIPIMVVSATFAGTKALRTVTDLGANAFMSAPVDPEIFIERSKSLLRGDYNQNVANIMFVEPDSTVACQLKEVFEESGYNTLHVQTGTMARKEFASKHFDVLILNHHLPDTSGQELLKEFYALNPSAVYIMSTSDSHPGFAVDWLNLGASGYLRKPYDPEYALKICTSSRRARALINIEDLLHERTMALKESEQRYRSLFQDSHSAMLIIDPSTGQIVEANQAASRYYGWSVDKLTSMKMSDMSMSSEEDSLGKIEKPDIESRSQFYFKHCLADGSVRDVEIFSGPILIEGKTMLYSIIHDITRRKRMEHELVQSNMDLKMAEEVAGMGSWKYDPVQDFFTGSEGFFRIMRIQPDLKLSFSGLLNKVHFEDRMEFSKVWEKVLHSFESFDFEFRIVSGQNFKCIRFIGAAQTRIHERSVAVMGMAMDISEKKALELKKKQHQEQLAQASKITALGTLVAGVAHEINNPNNLIMLNTPILENAWKDSLPVLEAYHNKNPDFQIAELPFSVMKDYMFRLFSGVNEGSKRISTIVSELKDFARQSPLDTSKYVDINEVAESALTLVEKTMSKFTSNFTFHPQPDLPLILGDFQKLEQVVVNLLINAGQALDSKSQSVSFETFHNLEKKSVGFKITDQGAGISQDIIKRIFDPFFSTKRQPEGTGLGLSISSSIIQDHQGQLLIKSAPGQGTEATVLLKLPHTST
ncbi:response regulator [Desulfonatronovibrio magnus]|uniref:response regulator n=1 Tax=Desulfonatronovibrio magnus TaxID=698827 RepID=UPI000698E70F|nr:response regulator [Desulfonatronovibrio magnus]